MPNAPSCRRLTSYYCCVQPPGCQGDLGLNICEAHAFNTRDHFSLDVFVVNGWASGGTEELEDVLSRRLQELPPPVVRGASSVRGGGGSSGGAGAGSQGSPPDARPPPEQRVPPEDLAELAQVQGSAARRAEPAAASCVC